MSTIRIIGLDPSLRNTGVAIADYSLTTGKLDLVDLILIQTEKMEDGTKVRQTSDDLKCAQHIIRSLRKIVADHKPVIAASEISVFSKSARAMLTNGICVGVLASIPVPVIEVHLLEVKRAAGGEKTSSKDFMVQWAVGQWPNANWRTRKLKGDVVLLKENEHLADACAAISAGILTSQFSQATAMMIAMTKAA
jgi:Holliday junction resolvasome RuvABC endonuclease subunit